MDLEEIEVQKIEYMIEFDKTCDVEPFNPHIAMLINLSLNWEEQDNG